jgi:hypothetical protein
MTECVITDGSNEHFTVRGTAIIPNHEERKFRPPCPYPRRRVFTARQEGQLTLHGRFFRLDECCGGHEST